MTNFFQDNKKLDTLANYFLQAKVDNQVQEFELIIVSCYLKFNSLKNLIDKINVLVEEYTYWFMKSTCLRKKKLG